MNIGSSTKFNSVLNDFHSVVQGTTFYTNSDSTDPPPPTGPLWLGTDSTLEEPLLPGQTFFFSINGLPLGDTVGQGYMQYVRETADTGYATITKNSGYSGNVLHKFADIPLLFGGPVGTFYFRFQSDANVPLRWYEVTSNQIPSSKARVATQVELIPELEIFIPFGSHSRLQFRQDGIALQGPGLQPDLPQDLTVTIVREIQGPDETAGGTVPYFVIVHDPTVVRRRVLLPLESNEDQ